MLEVLINWRLRIQFGIRVASLFADKRRTAMLGDAGRRGATRGGAGRHGAARDYARSGEKLCALCAYKVSNTLRPQRTTWRYELLFGFSENLRLYDGRRNKRDIWFPRLKKAGRKKSLMYTCDACPTQGLYWFLSWTFTLRLRSQKSIRKSLLRDDRFLIRSLNIRNWIQSVKMPKRY